MLKILQAMSHDSQFVIYLKHANYAIQKFSNTKTNLKNQISPTHNAGTAPARRQSKTS